MEKGARREAVVVSAVCMSPARLIFSWVDRWLSMQSEYPVILTVGVFLYPGYAVAQTCHPRLFQWQITACFCTQSLRETPGAAGRRSLEEVSAPFQAGRSRPGLVVLLCKVSSFLLSQALSGGYTDHLLFHFPQTDLTTHPPTKMGGLWRRRKGVVGVSVKMDLSATTWQCVSCHFICFEMSLQET